MFRHFISDRCGDVSLWTRGQSQEQWHVGDEFNVVSLLGRTAFAEVLVRILEEHETRRYNVIKQALRIDTLDKTSGKY